jgi:SAM-dependent methyltransferase
MDRAGHTAETLKNTQCLNCGSTKLERFLDLGDQPNGNRFPDPASPEPEHYFPFSMAVCTECWQVQLEESPTPEFMFTNHPYITGINKPVVEHFDRLAEHIVERFDLPEASLVIDIGCNDGSLLSCFAARGLRVLGVDPGQTTGALCRARGITVCETFWNRDTGRALKHLNVAPHLITATAVFYHVPDLHEFVEALGEVMTEETVFVTQCIYLKDVLEKNQFDHFYHEHIMIHSLAPLERLFEAHEMKLIDVEFDPIHGGSFILYVALKASRHPQSPTVATAIADETAGLQSIDTYREFAGRAQRNRDALLALLEDLNNEGKTVYGLCAPVKGSTLINYANIGPELVELTTDVNPYKIGKLMPGTHIPIVDETTLSSQPDYYLLLSWNFLDYFLEKYREYLEAGGKFIVPNPEVRVIGAEALAAVR